MPRPGPRGDHRPFGKLHRLRPERRPAIGSSTPEAPERSDSPPPSGAVGALRQQQRNIPRDYPDLVQQWFLTPKPQGCPFFTPTFTTNHGSFEQDGVRWAYTQEEMIAFLDALPKDYLTMHHRGGHPGRQGVAEGFFKVPLLVFSKPATPFDPADLHALKKPIVYIQAMIHGSKTSGCEAALRIAAQLARDELKVLDKISSGHAASVQRGRRLEIPARHGHHQPRAGPTWTKTGTTPPSSPLPRLMHTVANQYQPHVALDLHEMYYDHTADYNAADGSFVPLRDYHYFDLTTLVAHLHNVPAGITTLAQEMEANISADLSSRGLAWNFYAYPWDMTQERARFRSAANR